MKAIITQITFIILTVLFVTNLTFGQSMKEVPEKATIESSIKREYSISMDSLIGQWKLVKTIRHENGALIMAEPSMQLWLTPNAKPFTILRIDTLRNFEIRQDCMKCPYLFWEGRLEIERKVIKEIDFFYLNFIDKRHKT